MYYIGTKTQVDYYINKVNEGENYNGNTSTWANALPSFADAAKFAVVKHKNYNHSSMELVNELGNEFSPPQNEI